MDLKKLEATGDLEWCWEKADVTVEVFLGETLENETSTKGVDSSVMLFQKSSFIGPPDPGVLDLLALGVEAGGIWNPAIVSRRLFLFVGVLELWEDCSGIGTSALLPALSL